MKYIPLHKVFMAEELKTSVVDTLFSGYIGEGPQVEAFENELAEYLGVSPVTTVNSATSGLHLAIHILGNYHNERDEILATPLTCLATNLPILNNGYKIRWVDVDPKTCNMDLNDLRRCLGAKSRAVVPVHWGGYPVDLDELKKITQEYNANWRAPLPVIQDCAHAFGSTYKGKMIGSWSAQGTWGGTNTCVFSFGPIKTLTCGDGGAVTSSSPEQSKLVRLLRWYGIDRNHRDVGVQRPGSKYHMNDIAATIGRGNLKHVAANIATQRRNARLLRQGLADVPGLTLLEENTYSQSAYWLFTVMVERRADFIKKLSDAGIQSNVVHKRNDHHPVMYDYRAHLPGMNYVETHMTCIPCGWWVTEEDVAYIVETIKSGW